MYYEKIESDKAFVKLNFEDIKSSMSEEDRSSIDIPYFDITSEFNNINIKIKWHVISQPVNDFFKTVSITDQIVFIKMFDLMVKKLNEFFKRDQTTMGRFALIEAIKELATILHSGFDEIKFIDQIRNFVANNLYIGDFSKAGSNPQDKEEITYYETDAIELTTIAMISKIIFPIFGLFLSNYKRLPENVADQKDREIYCSYIFDKIMNDKLKKPYNKLYTYVLTYAKKKYDDIKMLPMIEKDDAYSDSQSNTRAFTTNTFNGITTDNIIDQTVANLLTKAFVNGNVEASEYEQRTILSYMDQTVGQNINKKAFGGKKGAMYYRRTDPSKKPDVTTPQFEIDSVASAQSLDILGLITTEIVNIVNEHTTLPEQKELYEKILAHHIYHGVEPTKLNQFCLSSYFGGMLGGGESILYLSNVHFSQLLSIYQMYLLEENRKRLIHLSSMKFHQKKIVPTQSDLEIQFSVTGLPVMKSYKNRNPFSSGVFEKAIKNIISEIVESEFTFNTPDILWTHLEEKNYNGHIIEPDIVAFVELLSLL